MRSEESKCKREICAQISSRLFCCSVGSTMRYAYIDPVTEVIGSGHIYVSLSHGVFYSFRSITTLALIGKGNDARGLVRSE